MKKTLLVLFAIACTLIAKADEGMWTLYNLPQAVYQQMKGQGFDLPYNSIYKGKDAIVRVWLCRQMGLFSLITIVVSRLFVVIQPLNTII